MAFSSPRKSSILYQSVDGTVAVIDVPGTIADAQGATCYEGTSSFDLLRATHPLIEPYEVPKEDIDENRAYDGLDLDKHRVYKALIQDALQHIREDYGPPGRVDWYRDRALILPNLQDKLPDIVLSEMADATADDDHWMTFKVRGESTSEQQKEEKWRSIFHNAYDKQVELTIRQLETGKQHTFIIPPRCIVMQGRCVDKHMNISTIAANFGRRAEFDLVVMDPPWPNMDVKRAKVYETAYSFPGLMRTLRYTGIGKRLAPAALVAVWVTNAKKSYDLVIDELFPEWDLEVVEKWIWLKTTIIGEPQTHLDYNQRHPYEVCLLARRRATIPEGHEVITRVLAGCADIHSRKPCLKALLEPLLPNRHDYNAIELFARYLTAGWWAWGDQALKFQWDRCWVRFDGSRFVACDRSLRKRKSSKDETDEGDDEEDGKADKRAKHTHV